MPVATYDLLVIGSGPAGQKAAIAAAKHGKRAAIIDRRNLLGGVSLHSGTIPSKTLREAILYLTGYRQRAFYGANYVLKERITVADLNARVRTVIDREMSTVVAQLKRNEIDVLPGLARFLDPHTLLVENEESAHEVRGDKILIACGTRPARSPAIECDGKSVFVADQISQIESLPRHLIVVGGGVVGIEYASMFATLGIEVTVIDQRDVLLDFVDEEIIDTLLVIMRKMRTTFRLGETVARVTKDKNGRVTASTESGKTIHAEALLYTVGRQVNTDTLDLQKAGLAADDRGRIAVDPSFRTAVPHIYAAGDVIGFPALASTSMEQGRIAVNCMFDESKCQLLGLLPYGIYTIPEISMIGKTEHQLTAAKIPYEVGVARFNELAKGQMVGAEEGVLKLLFDPTSLKVLGVHAIGENAAEIVHIGQAVMTLNGTMQYFRDTVFNYPTFAEAYKVAALNGLNKVG